MTTRLALPALALAFAAALAALSPACGGKVVFEPVEVGARGSCEALCDAYVQADCAADDCSAQCDAVLAAGAGACEPELAAFLACLTAGLVSGDGCDELPIDCIGPGTAYTACLVQSSSSAHVSAGVGGG